MVNCNPGTVSTATAAAKGVAAYRLGKGTVRSLQAYHNNIG